MTAHDVRSLVDSVARIRPDQSFVESARDDRVMRYGDLAATVDRWAEVGLPSPDRPVLLACEDPVRFAVAYVALLAAGRLVAPVAAADVAATLTYDPRRPALLVTDDADLEPAGLPRLLVDDAGRPATATAGGASTTGTGRVLLPSSGTTGPRKGIELSEAALLQAAADVVRALELTPDDRGYNPLPLVHVNAEVVGVLATLTAGATLVLDRRFSRTGFWELMTVRDVTWINAVPAILAILSSSGVAEADPGPDARRVRLVRSASSPLPVPVLERFERRYGIPVVETYGMTEAASQITSNPVAGPRKPGSVGRPVSVELRVVDDRRRPVPAGRLGRVQIRGRTVVGAYVGGAGADRFDRDGWLDTGDLGQLDRDGYLFLSGRDSDVINRGGEKVFPVDVERVLLEEPAVRAAAVAGRDDPVLGQVPVGFVVVDSPDPALAGELLPRLMQRCARMLPRRSRPVALHVVDEFPLGPTGKVLRRALTEPVTVTG